MHLSRFFLLSILLLVIFSFLSSSAQAGSTTATTRVILIGLSDSAVVTADGNVITHDIGGWYQVPAGDVKIEIKEADELVFSTTMHFVAGEDSRIIMECRMGCAQIKIDSKPSGAKLAIDGKNYGVTPFVNKYFRPGNRTVELSLKDYAPLKHGFSISPGQSQDLDLQLSRSQAWKDSVAQIALKQKRSRQMVQKAIFGFLTATFAGAGLYYEMYARSQSSAATIEAQAYDAAAISEECTIHRNAYEANRSNARKAIGFRNTLMGVAGGCLVGFGLSFVF